MSFWFVVKKKKQKNPGNHFWTGWQMWGCQCFCGSQFWCCRSCGKSLQVDSGELRRGCKMKHLLVSHVQWSRCCGDPRGLSCSAGAGGGGGGGGDDCIAEKNVLIESLKHWMKWLCSGIKRGVNDSFGFGKVTPNWGWHLKSHVGTRDSVLTFSCDRRGEPK